MLNIGIKAEDKFTPIATKLILQLTLLGSIVDIKEQLHCYKNDWSLDSEYAIAQLGCWSRAINEYSTLLSLQIIHNF